MPPVNRCCWLVAAALLCVLAPVVQAQAQAQGQAQGDVTERQVKVATGHDERVGVYTNIKPDCTGGPLPAIRLLVAPAHGSVTVKRGTLKATNFKQCLAAEVPALLAFYRSAANFNGSDEFELEITLQGGRKQVQHFRSRRQGHDAGFGYSRFQRETHIDKTKMLDARLDPREAP
jgi:hypothetical protein